MDSLTINLETLDVFEKVDERYLECQFGLVLLQRFLIINNYKKLTVKTRQYNCIKYKSIGRYFEEG
jgi:hypothetical protein